MSTKHSLAIATKFRPLTLALWAGLAMLAPASAALAQETATDEAKSEEKAKVTTIATITVTAQKREQQIQEVPIAISAYSGEFLEANGMANYQDIGNLVPGLEVQMQSVANPSLSIRGITADLDDPTQEPRISVYQDGVSMSRSRGSFVEPFDLDRVEVLRGPQGTLFGRAAEIGALHFIQNKANKHTQSGVEFAAGNDNQRKFTGFYNTALSDNVYGRVAVFSETRDGYVENLDGGTLQGKDTRAVRGSLHFNVGESSAMDLILNHEKDKPAGTAFRSMVFPNTHGSFDPYVANSQRGDALGTEREVNSATLLGRFRLNDNWTLNTISGWRDVDSLDKFDSDGSQLDLIEFDEAASGRQVSQELRFSFDNGGNFTGFFGANFFDENGKRDLTYQGDERQLYALFSPIINASVAGNISQLFQSAPYNFPAQVADVVAQGYSDYYYPITSVLNPDLTANTSTASTWLPVPLLPPSLGNPLGFVPAPLNPNHIETFGNDVDVRATEIFADGTWRFNDKWELTLGVRGTHEKATYGYHADAGNGSTLGYLLSARFPSPACVGLAPCTNLLFPASAGRLSDSGDWSSWVGRSVLRYSINENDSVYASISRGRRPTMLQVNDLGSTEIPAEIVVSSEIGFKGQSDNGNIAYDLTAFYYDYSDFQASIPNPTPPPVHIIANAGLAHAAGVEASFFAKLSEHVTGFFNYGWIDGGFNGVDKDGTPQVLAGNKFRMTPKNTLSIGLDFTIPLANGRSFFFRPNANWRSKVFFEDDNNPVAFGLSFAGKVQQEGYGLLNLRTGITFNEHWTLTASIDNALNKKYLIDAGNTGLIFGIPTVIPGATRTFGVSIRGKF